LAVLQDQKRLVLHVCHELLPRRVDTLVRQLERSMVDRDAGLGAQDLMALTASSGAICTGDMNQRGSYAPIGNNARRGDPNFSRIWAR